MRLGVIGLDIAHAALGELAEAAVHLADHPLQRADHLIRLGDHRGEQVRDAVVGGQLHALGVHQHQAQLGGGVIEQQAGEDGVDAHALARAGGAGDHQMRHGGKIAGGGAPGHILAQGKTQRRAHLLESVGFDQLAQGHQADLGVGHLDAHVHVPGDGRLDADARGGQGQGQVVGEAHDLRDAHARASLARLDEIGLHAKLGDGGSALDLHHVGGHAEGGQGLLDDLGAFLIHPGADEGGRGRVEDIFHGGQRPGGIGGRRGIGDGRQGGRLSRYWYAEP